MGGGAVYRDPAAHLVFSMQGLSWGGHGLRQWETGL